MPNYTLKHKNRNLCTFSHERTNVIYAALKKEYVAYLPLPLQRIINHRTEFIEFETPDFFFANEEGCYLLEAWLSDREIPINRDNFNKYIARGKTARQWMLENNAFSFTDCYWIEKEGEELSWEDILQKMSDVDTFFSVRDNNRHYKGHNSTLGGELEKFWYKENGKLKLCKKVDKQYDILNAREVLASLIYKMQGYEHFCDYHFIYDSTDEIIGCTCDAFTDVDTELITAFDLLEKDNFTQQNNVYELIIQAAVSLGLKEQLVQDYMDIQILVDYLITNRDRHQGNIGFLRNADTLKLIDVAPVYDSGSSKIKEGEAPETITGTTINGLYPTETECLSHVKNLQLIDLAKLPTREMVKTLLDKCHYLSEYRKEKLIQLYLDKIIYLRTLQQMQ